MSRQTDALMGLGSLGIVGSDPDYITQLVSDVRRFSEVLLSLKEALSSTGKGLNVNAGLKECVFGHVCKICVFFS